MRVRLVSSFFLRLPQIPPLLLGCVEPRPSVGGVADHRIVGQRHGEKLSICMHRRSPINEPGNDPIWMGQKSTFQVGKFERKSRNA
jgi:hypothetical protein